MGTLTITKPTFTEHDHKYESSLGTYTSVTTLIHKFVTPFDVDKIAKEYVEKRNFNKLVNDLSTKYSMPDLEVISILNQYGSVDGVKHIWKLENTRACEEGTKTHLIKEQAVRGRSEFKMRSGNVIPLGADHLHCFDLYTLPDGVYPELLIWNNELMIAGQSDVVVIETIDGVRYVDIIDYKTNKEIKKCNYIDRSGNPVYNKFMLFPLEAYCDCNFWHYQIQLNIYAWLLTQFGFKFRGGTIIHTKDDNKKYDLIDLQADVQKLMMLWKQNLQKK